MNYQTSDFTHLTAWGGISGINISSYMSKKIELASQRQFLLKLIQLKNVPGGAFPFQIIC
jgi:hypothetical protein